MELTFTLNDNAKWKTGKFVVENLQISDKLGKQDSQWEDDIT